VSECRAWCGYEAGVGGRGVVMVWVGPMNEEDGG
jgi:hypothetical protein